MYIMVTCVYLTAIRIRRNVVFDNAVGRGASLHQLGPVPYTWQHCEALAARSKSRSNNKGITAQRTNHQRRVYTECTPIYPHMNPALCTVYHITTPRPWYTMVYYYKRHNRITESLVIRRLFSVLASCAGCVFLTSCICSVLFSTLLSCHYSFRCSFTLNVALSLYA